MISAISGLPELVIEKQNDVHIDIELNNRLHPDADIKTAQDNKKETASTKSEVKERKFNQESVDDLNKELKGIFEGSELNVEFKFEKDANQLIMKLINQETKEVIRQVPPDVMLKIAKIVSAQLGSGALADAKV